MEQLNQFLKNLVSTSGKELHLEPNRKPYIVSSGGVMDIDTPPLQGTQISTMVFPLIPPDVKQDLPNEPKIEFVHPHNLGKFSFTVQKSPAGFNVTVRPLSDNEVAPAPTQAAPQAAVEQPIQAAPALEQPDQEFVFESSSLQMNEQAALETPAQAIPEIELEESEPVVEPFTAGSPEIDVVSANDPQFVTVFSDSSTYEPLGRRDEYAQPGGFVPPLEEYVPASEPKQDPFAQAETKKEGPVVAEPLVERRSYTGDRRKHNSLMQDRMDALFRQMADVGASDLHLSVSMAPMVRKDGKMAKLECVEAALTPEVMAELLHSIMPEKNREEFARRNDTDFAYEIAGLARFRCNVFMDRKGMGGVFRIIPTKILQQNSLACRKR